MNNIATQNGYSEPICTCPHCNSTSITRSGFDRGDQRYRCKNCCRTFKATTGTSTHGLHKKDKIKKYLKALREGMSVRKAAEYTGISKNTSFAWRHKFLSSLQESSMFQSQNEISSAEIIQLRYSAKGRRKPPEKNTSATKTILLFRYGQLELHKLKTMKQTMHLAQIFSENSAKFFVLKPHKTITAGIKHSESFKINSRKISQPLIAQAKLQKEKLFRWMERFKGVASKYLQNYWNWYASLLNLSQLKQETLHFHRLCTNNRSLTRYLDIKNI